MTLLSIFAFTCVNKITPPDTPSTETIFKNLYTDTLHGEYMKFHMPTTIVFRSGSIQTLKKIVTKQLQCSNPLLVTDKGIKKVGIAEKVTSQFEEIQIFDEVEQNPKASTVNEAGELAREGCDLVIGLGGGSSIDTAKAAALLATNTGSIEDYEGKEKYNDPPLPVIAIPTTCGTGSEVTWVSVVTDTQRQFKMSIKGSEMFPEIAVVDPDLIVSLPQPLIASTGMDALTHAIEAYTVKPRTPITDIFARRAVQLISNSIEDAYEDIEGKKNTRECIMLGSTLAGVAFGNSDVGGVHCIAEAVGGLYDIPHGVANSLFLPYVMEFNLPAVESRYAEIARFMEIDENNDKTAAKKLIARIHSLSNKLNIPSFNDLNIEEDAFEKIAQRSVENNSNPSNPRKADVDDYMTILKKCI